MPDVRSDTDCRRLIARLQKPIYRGCFTLIYAYGLRIGEAVALPVTAVDSKQMVLRIIGKGNKQRALPLTDSILAMLREVWKIRRSPRWLFPSRRIITHLPYATARLAFNKARSECGFDDRFRPHSLRHSFATHLKELCARKRHLGGLPGILSVLHTCNAQLGYHPHVHMLITAGGITPDGEHWEPTRGEYLVPVGLLSKKIAAEFRDALKKQDPELFASIPAAVWRREWVSFVKHYGHGNDAVLDYLSRYVFRTAISNSRILRMDDTHVTFRYKDRKTGKWRTMRLPGVEFLRRFLTHVLPRGFHRVRYYGLWHHSKPWGNSPNSMTTRTRAKVTKATARKTRVVLTAAV